MLLRVSNAKLQDELRDTMKAYVEEKSMLRAHLANLRLDLDELHRDDRTITTDESDNSSVSISNGSEPELKRLEDFRGEMGKSLHLPQIKSFNMTPRKKGVGKRGKNLRFNTNPNIDLGGTEESMNKSFLHDPSWDLETREKQKFQELQKNQEALRNIGRANLRDKRHSLIRLPTITSAKRRAIWDSGKNVSRPKGKSTTFESFPYVEASIQMSKKNFKIPDIKDPQRSEIQLKDFKRLDMNKKKVKFTKPDLSEPEGRMKEKDLNTSTASVMGGESLNTTLADTSLGDTTIGNISFDEEQIRALQQRSLGESTVNTTAIVSKDDENSVGDGDLKNTTKATVETSVDSKGNASIAKKDTLALPEIPRLKVGKLAKRNVLLHDMNIMRASPSQLVLPKVTAGNSDKVSDRSVGTKISRLSQETESYKSLYMSIPDPDVRTKTLSDIMFAVRSRMKENEETMRFGETPRPSDHTYCDYLLTKHSPRRSIANKSNNASDASSTYRSPRNGKAKKSHRGLPTNTAVRANKRNDTAASLQKYLKKMYRQRRTIDRMSGEEYRLAHFAGHKDLQLVAQEA